MVAKYFGEEDPIGKTINAEEQTDYIVTAVIEDVPENSHFHFDFLRSLERYEDARSPVWVFNDFHTYILFKKNVNLVEIEEKLYGIVKERLYLFLRGILGISVEQFLERRG